MTTTSTRDFSFRKVARWRRQSRSQSHWKKAMRKRRNLKNEVSKQVATVILILVDQRNTDGPRGQKYFLD